MFKIFNDENFFVLTHFDLDGSGGPLLLRHCFGEQIAKVIPTGYGKITGIIKKNSTKNIFITDINLTQEQIDLTNELYENVYLFDHHETSIGLKYPKHWKVFLNTKACATKLIYLWLEHNGFDLSSAKSFVNTVNEYDIWIDPAGNCKYLNNIFWNLSFWKFSKAFKNFTWDKELWKKAKELEKIKVKEILEMENYEIENLIRVVIGNKYVSDITLHYPENNFIIISKDDKISIRSNKNLLPFYDQLKELNIAVGGHKFAGGITHNEPMEIIELFYNFLKEV